MTNAFHRNKQTPRACLTVLACLAMLNSTFAKQPADPTQFWKGTLDVGVAKLRLQFKIALDRDKGEFSGHLISLDQGNAKVPLSKMTIEDDTITMKFDSIHADFTGKIGADKNTCVGKWTQLGKPYDFTIQRAAAEEELTHSQTWKGDLAAGPKTFNFQFRIHVDKTGTPIGRFDSFSERMLDLPTEFESNDDGFKFSLPSIKATFAGKYNDDRSQVVGTWTQLTNKLPLTFTQLPLEETRWSAPKPNRPQHPKAPFPYASKPVTFENKTDKVILAGTLTLPNDKDSKKFPAVVLVTGSGPQDRDETIFDHRPFLVIADHLTRNGIAVLRYDDRGVGKSTGKFSGTTTEAFSRDAESAIDFLKQHPSINAEKVGLIGHSEGGIVGPMIAARRDDVAFIVMLAGPGITGKSISISQSHAMSKAAGLADDYVATQDEALQVVIDEVQRSEKPITEEKITELLETIAAKSDMHREHTERMKTAMMRLTDPWMANYLRSDPGPDLRKTTCPVLALNGEKDLQVLPDLNLIAIQSHLKSAGNEDFQTMELKSLNHLFQTAETGTIDEYGKIEETFSPKALAIITEWIAKRTMTNEP